MVVDEVRPLVEILLGDTVEVMLEDWIEARGDSFWGGGRLDGGFRINPDEIRNGILSVPAASSFLKVEMRGEFPLEFTKEASDKALLAFEPYFPRDAGLAQPVF